MYQNRGFTLIELLVVVLIIAILSAVALPQYQKAVAKSRAAAAFIKVAAIETAEEEFKLANGHYTPDFSNLSINTDGWNCAGVARCNYPVVAGLIFSFSFNSGNSTPPAYRLYCIADKDNKIYQDICRQYGTYRETNTNLYYIIREAR